MFENALKKEKRTKGFARLWHRFFLKPIPMPRVVLELSDSELKILGFRKNGTLKIDFAKILNLPKEVYADGIVKDANTFSMLLRQDFKSNVPKNISAIAIIPEEKVFSKIIQQRFGEVHTLNDLVRQALPLPKEEMVFAIKEIVPLSRQITHKDFNVWAVEKNYFESYRDVLKIAGIEPVDFIPESLGIISAIFPKRETSDACLVVVPEVNKITLLIFAGRAVHVSKTIFGLDHVKVAPGLVGEFIDAVKEAIIYYRDRVLHEHGASS
ncbi:MAG: hypothetical protein ACK4NX_03275, partial [Candidatus Paceibacteria bacterium]